MHAYKSKTMLAVDALRDRILAGEIEPGERFDVRRIAAELEMSITPIREALRILQADGLVAYDEHRSISAMKLQPDDAEELYLLRAVVEQLAAELAAANRDESDCEAIRAAHADMLGAAKARDNEGAALANRHWHFAVYKAAKTKYIEPVIVRLWTRYAWSTIYTIPGRLEHSVAEHASITDAVLAGDAKLAGRLMRAHVLEGRKAVVRHREGSERARRASRRTTAKNASR